MSKEKMNENQRGLTVDKYRDIIFESVVRKQSVQAIANRVGLSESTITACLFVYSAFENDLDGLAERAARDRSITKKMVMLTAEILRVNAPDTIIATINEREVKAYAEKKEQTDAKQDLPAASNDAVYFIRILEELHEQNELLRSLLDVVLPKHLEDLSKEIEHAAQNVDSLYYLTKDEIDILKGIKCNLRKNNRREADIS